MLAQHTARQKASLNLRSTDTAENSTHTGPSAKKDFSPPKSSQAQNQLNWKVHYIESSSNSAVPSRIAKDNTGKKHNDHFSNTSYKANEPSLCSACRYRYSKQNKCNWTGMVCPGGLFPWSHWASGDILRSNGRCMQVIWLAAMIPAAGEMCKDCKSQFCNGKAQLTKLDTSGNWACLYDFKWF